jgi:hypothetical protein
MSGVLVNKISCAADRDDYDHRRDAASQMILIRKLRERAPTKRYPPWLRSL